MAADFDIGPADWEADRRAADELTRASQELGLYATGGEVNGKGDAPRPMAVDAETYGKRWAETFRTCPGYGIGPCDRMGPNGSCAACGKGLETLGDPEE